jgi:hypothetical protein
MLLSRPAGRVELRPLRKAELRLLSGAASIGRQAEKQAEQGSGGRLKQLLVGVVKVAMQLAAEVRSPVAFGP